MIDVGMNRTDDGLVGDVDFESAARPRAGDHAGPRRRRADDDRDAPANTLKAAARPRGTVRSA